MKKNKDVKSVLKKIYCLLDFKQKVNFVIIIFIMIISSILTQLTPKAIGFLTDDILIRSEVVFSKVIPLLIFILIVNILNEVIKIIRRIMVEDTATKTEKKARSMVISSLLKAPLSYFRENMTGNIHGRLNRCLEGTVKLEKLLFMDFVPAIFNSIAAIVTIFLTLPFLLALPMLLVIPVGIFIVFRQISTQRGIRVELLETKSYMDGVVVELLNGIEVIRITDSAALETNRFDINGEALRSKEMKHHKEMAKYDFIKFINQAVFTVLIIGISTYAATKGIISVGSVLTAYLCFTQLTKPLEELHRIFDELSECSVLAKDFFKMLELPKDFSYKKLKVKKVKNNDIDSIIAIRDLTFYYNENKDKIILNNFNLDIKEGTFLGIAGPSGCGKSSLIKAICKLEESSGKIIINGYDINALSRKDISNIIALVPQSPFLISGTIYENICYGIDYNPTLEEVIDACKKAYIFDYINGLPKKFDTLIAEGGSNLSGGQRQRIAIARIFLRKPKILILDEATSALDNTTERYIQSSIERLRDDYNITIISIAHRLTTLKNCDQIIVLDKGIIKESDKYDELIDKKGIFSDMYYGKLK